jgi:hypothetical protein
VVGTGDFTGNGTDDILFRNNSTGDTWIEAISNGAFAGWHQIGGSNTSYSAVGVGDFFGNGTDDILFRNNSSGDTWIEAISNGAFASWQQVGGSNTTYAVAASLTGALITISPFRAPPLKGSTRHASAPGAARGCAGFYIMPSGPAPATATKGVKSSIIIPSSDPLDPFAP